MFHIVNNLFEEITFSMILFLFLFFFIFEALLFLAAKFAIFNVRHVYLMIKRTKNLQHAQGY